MEFWQLKGKQVKNIHTDETDEVADIDYVSDYNKCCKVVVLKEYGRWEHELFSKHWKVEEV